MNRFVNYPLIVSTSLLILLINPINTLPGPTSVNDVAPSAIICCTDCVQRTGAVNCVIKFFLISTGSETALAVTFWYTGQIGVEKVVASIAAANSSRAGSIIGEWKAPPTGKINARLAPASFIFSQANSTAFVSPEITNCPGQL